MVVVATFPWKVARTRILKAPAPTGFATATLACPRASETVSKLKLPRAKVTCAPLSGASKATYAPATGWLFLSRTSTTGFTAVFFLRLFKPFSPARTTIFNGADASAGAPVAWR